MIPVGESRPGRGDPPQEVVLKRDMRHWAVNAALAWGSGENPRQSCSCSPCEQWKDRYGASDTPL
jgi:hypothetical protein